MMTKSKWAAWIAGLCLLCCAAPLLALFGGGLGLAGIAGAGLFSGGGVEIVLCLMAAAGFGAALFAVWRIWTRQISGASCELPPSG